MANTIGRDLSKMDLAIQKINSSIKDSEKILKNLDSAIVKNSGDIDSVRNKFAQMAKVTDDLKLKTDELKKKQELLNQALASGHLTQDEYNKKTLATTRALTDVANKTAEYSKRLAQQNAEIRNAKYDNFINGAKKAEQATQKFSRAVTMGAVALVAFIAVGMKAGDELDDIANKYQTTSEALQLQRNRYDKLTESKQGYENSLKAIGSMQASIAGGRGAKYLNFLKELGLSQQDLNGKTNGKIYDIIFAKLQSMTDATDRARIAQNLFGDSGNNVALVAGMTSEELAKLDEAYIKNGITTNEQAAIAGKYADMVADIKQKIMEFSLFLLEKWDSLNPFMQGLLMFLLTSIIILPKVIGFVGGIAGVIKLLGASAASATPGIAGLSLAASKILIVIGLVAAAIIAIIGLIGLFSSSAKKAADDAKKVTDEATKTAEAVNGLKADMGYETNITAESNSRRTIDMNINVDSRGDTPISQGTANLIVSSVVAQINGETVNEEWGRKIVGG